MGFNCLFMTLIAQKNKVDLIFQVESFVLASALNVNSGVDTHVVLHPLNDQIMISNLTGDYAMYKLIDSNAFTEYSYHKEIKDSMLKSGDVEYYVFDKTSLIQLLSKIDGLVKITIDSKRESVRKLHVEDVNSVDVKFTGHVTLGDHTISKNRATTIFLTYFHEKKLIIPTTYLAGNDFHIFKLRKGVEFNPLIVNSKGNDQIKISLMGMNETSAELKIENNTLDSSFSSNFSYALYQTTNEKIIAENNSYQKTIFKNGYNPKVIQNILRFASGNYSYLIVLSVGDDNYFLFGSYEEVENLQGESFAIRCITNPFIEELSDDLDLSDINIEMLN